MTHGMTHVWAPNDAEQDVQLFVGSGEMHILDETGDDRLQWNRNSASEVLAARDKFNEYKVKGYLAYKVDKSGRQGEVIKDFDPNAERIILHAPMIGG